MPIANADLKYFLSGGVSNADANLSLGGEASSTPASAALFDTKGSAEAAAGRTEYRCLYLKNTHATITGTAVKAWIKTNTPGPDTALSIGLGAVPVGGLEPSVLDETTAPAGVTFSAAADEANALAIADLAPGATRSLWIRLTVNAGAAPGSESYALSFKCDTAA
jgi:hypothetical protein